MASEIVEEVRSGVSLVFGEARRGSDEVTVPSFSRIGLAWRRYPTGAFFSRCLVSPISLTRGELDRGVPVIIDRLTGKTRLSDRNGAHTTGLGGDRQRARAAGAGQYQSRDHQGLPVRGADQSPHTLRWRRITTLQSCRRGRADRATRPRSKLRCS